jgi:hypothetical protein
MQKVTLTLELTYDEAEKVLALLNMPSEAHNSLSANVLPKQVEVPAPTATKPQRAPKAGGKKGPKMPAFGRTIAQVDSFIENERTRVTKLDEEAELKAQRAEEKAARDGVKTEEAEKITDEVKAIKDANISKTSTSTMPKKLWQL